MCLFVKFEGQSFQQCQDNQSASPKEQDRCNGVLSLRRLAGGILGKAVTVQNKSNCNRCDSDS